MTRATWHTFTTSAPTFGEDDSFDPFFEPAERTAAPYLPVGESPAVAPNPQDVRGFPDTLLAR